MHHLGRLNCRQRSWTKINNFDGEDEEARVTSGHNVVIDGWMDNRENVWSYTCQPDSY